MPKFADIFGIEEKPKRKGSSLAVAVGKADLQALEERVSARLDRVEEAAEESASRASAAFKLAAVGGLMTARLSRELRAFSASGALDEAGLEKAESRFVEIIQRIAEEPEMSAREVEKLINRSFNKRTKMALLRDLVEQAEGEEEELALVAGEENGDGS